VREAERNAPVKSGEGVFRCASHNLLGFSMIWSLASDLNSLVSVGSMRCRISFSEAVLFGVMTKQQEAKP
jgi:hypothetical protein